MTAMFLDNNDALFLFGNNSNNPYAFRLFNDIMRQYYDSNGNPIKQQQQTNENTSQNENREIVSSVQSTTATETTIDSKIRRKDTLTLDLLLPKPMNNSSYYSYPSYSMEEAGEEVLASEHQRRRSDKNDFDIRDYISSVYNYHNRQQQQGNQNNNNNSKKLTLAHLLNAREKSKSRTFIFAKESDY
jgi:uncharacterized protein (DUF2225 family)